MKKFIALCLCIVMVLSMAACGKKTEAPTEPEKKTEADKGTEATDKTEAPTDPVVEYPDYVKEPIEIEIWHASGSGANGDYMTKAIEEFNKSNEYGITVIETYGGNYAEVLSKTSTAIAADEAPEIIVAGSSGMPVLGNQGALADMSGYAARDGVDMNNFVAGTTDFCYNSKGELISIPFNRSTAVFYYNKTLWDELKLEAPTSLEDLAEKAAYIHEQKGIYGFGAHFDAFFFQEAWVRSLGADGLVASDGLAAAALESGEFNKLMTDWLGWVKAGWCRVPAVTSAEGDMKDALYAGELASMVASCGGLKNMLKYSKEAGFELGVSLMPAYGGYGSNGGGGNLCIISKDKTQQEIAASWEFIKFLSTDEKVAERAASTGYLPVTYTSTETEEVKKLWEEKPQYKVAFDQLQYTKDANWSEYQSEWNTYLKTAMSYVIQDGSMTPDEATEYLKEQAKIIFPNGSGK